MLTSDLTCFSVAMLSPYGKHLTPAIILEPIILCFSYHLQKKVPYFTFFFLVILGFELIALCLLDRHSTTWATLVLWCWGSNPGPQAFTVSRTVLCKNKWVSEYIYFGKGILKSCSDHKVKLQKLAWAAMGHCMFHFFSSLVWGWSFLHNVPSHLLAS
jgi:hypothetical protein